MHAHKRAFGTLALLVSLPLLAMPIPAAAKRAETPAAAAAPAAEAPAASMPASVQGTDNWLYHGTDIPQDPEWVFGALPNGVRYAVRRNNVPPGQVSIRVRIDAGSLYERPGEEGYAHLLEHLLFRESKYLGPAEAIPTWQRLGATFGSDTNAETSPTQTVYKLDLPNAAPAALEESFKLLSGMVREPVLSKTNIATEVPIVLAEMRERGGAGKRVSDATRQLYFKGQPLAERAPIGTEESLRGASAEAMQAFHARWYRPENTVVVAVGDADPAELARQVEKWFADWAADGAPAPAPDFGQPEMPKGADPRNPVGDTQVMVEPDLPRNISFAVLRPWVQVVDNLEYNRGLMLDVVAQAIINRRLETRARSGGSYLVAQVSQDDASRSADGTFVSVTPLSEDWETALKEVRAVIAGALARPPSQEEIDREVAEIDVYFASQVAEREVMAAAKLAEDIVQAVDIREAVASPETVLDVFRSMRERFTPDAILDHARALFDGKVIRTMMIAPNGGEASAAALGKAMKANVRPDNAQPAPVRHVSFADLPPIGTPGAIDVELPTGVLEVEAIKLSNGVRALIWPNNAEPGRVNVRVRFGPGRRGFAADDAPYIALGRMALISQGLGPLGQDELDWISTGRKMGFDFSIDDTTFRLSAETRAEDLADQLYLFAGKIGMPRWDAAPVERARAAAQLQYESYASQPSGVLGRDLDWLLSGKDPIFATPDPAMLEKTTPEDFRRVWEPLLKQGPIEVEIFGDFDRAAGLAALQKTFGALPAREPIPQDVLERKPSFPPANAEPVVLYHRGDPNQAAAVIAWPSGGGSENLPESRQLEILIQLFNNRLMDAMREHAGASYAPQVISDWPVDSPGGGRILAMAQLEPQAVPAFFEAAEQIAQDLANTLPGEDELARITEPLKQMVSRASTGNGFWMVNLEGSTYDPRRVTAIRSLLSDYTQTTPAAMQELARRYLTARPGWRLEILPQQSDLAGGSR